MACLIPSSLRSCCISCIDFHGLMCPGKSPSLSIPPCIWKIQSIREWVPWILRLHSGTAPAEKCHYLPYPKATLTMPGYCPWPSLDVGSCIQQRGSEGVYSVIMTVSGTGVCPTGWGCYSCAFIFFRFRGWTAQGTLPVLLPITSVLLFTLLIFSGIPPLSVPIKRCHKCWDLNL